MSGQGIYGQMRPFYQFTKIGYIQHQGGNPAWTMGVLEALHKLASLPTGRKLLEALARAEPQGRGAGFHRNVIVCIEESLIPASLRPAVDKHGNPTWRNTESADVRACHPAKRDWLGTQRNVGSTTRIMWGSSGTLMEDGSYAPAFVGLGHELIHALHFATGTGHPGIEEEYLTVGCKTVGGVEMIPSKPETLPEICENRLRSEAGKLDLRLDYRDACGFA